MGSGHSIGSAPERPRRAFHAATAVLLVALGATAQVAYADVTHIAVRFRDAASGISSAGDVARLQSIAAATRTGIGDAVVTHDGAYRIALAPALTDEGARAALDRLRMDASVLYADIVPDPAVPVVAATRDGYQPRLARIIVKFRDTQVAADAANDLPLDAARVAQLSARAGRPLAFNRTMPWARAHLLSLMAKAPQEEVEALARAIEQDPDVEWAQPDYLRFRQVVPNDPLYASQWHYFAPPGEPGGANLPTAWDRTIGWSGLRTAVLDTGSLKNHPDLANRHIAGYDFIFDWVTANDNDPPPPGGCAANPLLGGCNNRDADASDPGDWVSPADSAGSTFGGWLFGCPVDDSSWHGTHVAGTVGALTNNAAGVAGVNWVSRIVPVRVLGKCGGYDSDIADAMVWASGNGVAGVTANAYPARVLNLSLGGGGACPAITQNAINSALAQNTAVVVAAGNANSNVSGFTPGNCAGVVTVAAVGRLGQRASYSNFGALVEIAAPGGSDGELVLSTLNSGLTTPGSGAMNYEGYQGTSMATPHVAGIVSLMLSLKPSLTPANVTSILQATARPFPTGTGRDCTSDPAAVGGAVQFCGAGIVDTSAALANIANTGGTGGTALTVTSATLGSSSNPALVGSPVTLTATITGGTTAGRVAFSDDDVPIAGCTNVAIAAGPPLTAQCVTSSLPVGTRALRAVYTPYNPQAPLPASVTNTPADSPVLAQVINPVTPQPTTTTLTSSLNPSNQGDAVTFTASVAGSTPTGTVDFRANNVTLAGCGAVALVGAGNTRTAQCTTAALAAGSNAMSAIYAGDAFNLTSTGLLTQGVVAAGACATFNDVLSSSAFCSSVQWLSNRQITTGCTATEYCPTVDVGRLGMAAFLTREGGVLTPFDVPLVAGIITLNLTSPTNTCFNPANSYAVTGFPRRARLQASANVYGASASTAITVEHVYSTNGGTVWTVIPSTAVQLPWFSGRTPPDDQTATLHGELDLTVGTSYLFGLRFTAAPTATNVQVYCAYQARIHNRNGASAPF